jgi:hypothetical protein
VSPQADTMTRLQLTVLWALAETDEHGRQQPFNAIGVFVRLQSASGGRPTVGVGDSGRAPRKARPNRRFEVTDHQWAQRVPLLPATTPGRSAT